MNKMVDLGRLTRGGEVHNLSGHERGLAARDLFGLDQADQGDEVVDVTIPPDIHTLTPSFFQGMFSKSVQAGAGETVFRKRYRFTATPIVMRQIERGIVSVRTKRDDILTA